MLGRIGDEGVDDDRERMLLWLLRTLYDVGNADSYENVLPEPLDLGGGARVDAAIVVRRRDTTTAVYCVVADSDRMLKQRVQALARVLAETHQPEREFAKVNTRMRSILEPALMPDSAPVVRSIVGISTVPASKAQLTSIERIGHEAGIGVEAFDPNFLNALAIAERDGLVSVADVTMPLDSSSVLDLEITDTPAVVFPVFASQVATWPGVEDRTLFDLNVRHALGINKVRKSLDQALIDETSAPQFIAYHNGITAVCRHFEIADGRITIEGLSVVNGAQTVVAIHANRERLSPTIRILLKLVVADVDSELARSIAIRSNTQNPVTSRNLRALDGVQERLSHDLSDLGYVYVTRPDQSSPSNNRVIRNDDAAQLLCSVYVRKPALAVKRQALFESPQYQEIFPENLPAERVVFVHVLKQAVENSIHLVPEFYRSAWALTSLTLVYMTAEAIRADREFMHALESPTASDVTAPDALRASVEPFVEAACRALHARRTKYVSDDNVELDDFKVAFKHTRTLGGLGAQAAREWLAQSRSART